MSSDDPKENSFCQRSWLYTQDPALLIKQAGRPTVKMTAELNQLSLQIGSAGPRKPYPETRFGRKAVCTGDLFTKTGYQRSEVFLDDHDVEVLRSLDHSMAR